MATSIRTFFGPPKCSSSSSSRRLLFLLCLTHWSRGSLAYCALPWSSLLKRSRNSVTTASHHHLSPICKHIETREAREATAGKKMQNFFQQGTSWSRTFFSALEATDPTRRRRACPNFSRSTTPNSRHYCLPPRHRQLYTTRLRCEGRRKSPSKRELSSNPSNHKKIYSLFFLHTFSRRTFTTSADSCMRWRSRLQLLL